VIIIPTKASVFDVLAIRRTVEYVQKAQQERPTLKGAILLNMIKAGSTLTAEGQKILNEYDLPILSTQISERVSYARSPLTNGIIGSDDSKAKQEITSLCTEIVNLTHGKA
jgi:chromosome partitioning protein